VCKHLALLVLAAAGMVAGCETNPATKKSQFSFLSRDQEVQMGLDAAPQMVQENGGVVQNADVAAYVTGVGAKMAAMTEGNNPSLPWKFTVLNSDIINAFALPGGQVFISKGLLVRMTNEAQMAGVLGHEIGHVTARHINDRAWQTTLVSGVASVSASVLSEGVGGNIGAMAPKVINFGGETLVLRFSRSQELEADSLGMRYMSNAGYNPKAQRQVMQILEASAGDATQAEWMSTHPYPKTRIEQIDKLLAGEYAGKAKGNEGLFEAEFRQRALAKLAQGPESETSRYAMMAAVSRFGSPSGWCAHCRP